MLFIHTVSLLIMMILVTFKICLEKQASSIAQTFDFLKAFLSSCKSNLNFQFIFFYISLSINMLIPLRHPSSFPPHRNLFLAHMHTSEKAGRWKLSEAFPSAYLVVMGLSSINLFAFMGKNRPIFVYTCTERYICI